MISLEIIVLVVVIGNMLFDYMIDTADVFMYKQADAEEIPYSYNIATGLHEGRWGTWNEEDGVANTIEKTTYIRNERNIEVIKTRLEKYGVDGLIKHLTRKATFTWGDGTYFSIYKLGLPHEYDAEELKYFVGTENKLYRYFAQAYQVTLLFFMIYSIWKRKKNLVDNMFIVHLAIFGTMMFLCIWESRSRYLINVTPMLLVAALDGVYLMVEKEESCEKN